MYNNVSLQLLQEMTVMQLNPEKLWQTGEISEQDGVNFSNCCGMELKLRYIAGDKFLLCPMCRGIIKWSLQKDEDTSL
jgi:hypothetical protein